MSELRFYTFVNGIYMSAIQHGIQSFHVGHEIFVKYRKASPENERLFDWAENHKTVIVLSAGAHGDLIEKYKILSDLTGLLQFPLPHTKFHEDEYSLGGVMTCFGGVLPQEIYDAVDYRKASMMFSSSEVPAVFGISTPHDPKEAFFFIEDGEIKNRYWKGMPEYDLISMLKSCSLAR